VELLAVWPMAPSKFVAQSQPQLPVVPVADPPFWHALPSAPTVHAGGVWQLAPE